VSDEVDETEATNANDDEIETANANDHSPGKDEQATNDDNVNTVPETLVEKPLDASNASTDTEGINCCTCVIG